MRTSDKIKFLSFKVSNLRNKVDELKCLVITGNSNETETFMDTTNNDPLSGYSIEGCKLLNKNHIKKRGWGVALYVARWLKPVKISPSDTYVKHVWVEINTSEFSDNTSVTSGKKPTNMIPNGTESCLNHSKTVNHWFWKTLIFTI